jgi:hypothetical protein
MFRRNRKTQKSQYPDEQTFEAHFNTYGEIELCQIDRETGLALVLVGRFNSTTLRLWQKANAVETSRIIWGRDNAAADLIWTRKHGFGQDY